MNVLTGWKDLVTARPGNATGPRGSNVEALFDLYSQQVTARANRFFWWLLIFQWIAAVVVAAVWSPLAWAGARSSVHPHLIAAVGLGALLIAPPLACIRWLPFHPMTRHAVAIAQMGTSSLLIHLSGGRIETHFHVFGSLAFLVLYRDWRVLQTAAVVVALDHLLRGLWFPESVYGVPFATVWRTVEHGGWVIFEDLILVWICLVSRREMWEICEQQDRNDKLLLGLEQRVAERTQELQCSEARYRKLMTHLPVGVFETTQDGQVRYANAHMLRVLGLPEDIDLAKIPLGKGGMAPVAQREQLWTKLLADGEVLGMEAKYRRPDGASVDLILNARLKPSVAGEPPTCEGTAEDITARKEAERERDALNRRLIEASRQAGMAEVATGVLHNVGNVLTSVNLTVHDLQERLQKSRIAHLQRAVAMIQAEQPRLAEFLTEDASGKQLPGFLERLSAHLVEEKERQSADLEKLAGHFTHIRDIIVTQQSSARMLGLVEDVPPYQLVEDALRLSAESFSRHGIEIRRDFAVTGSVRADRHKVLQILVNLLRNAKDAVERRADVRCVTIAISAAGNGEAVAIVVRDNGEGIPAENLGRLFQHGFTTKQDGHGFGLHSCVLAAREMQGDITAASDGRGMGAAFTLTLPLAA